MNQLPTTPGILPLRMGGLGNQIFIVAAGYAASRATGLPLYLPVLHKERNKHNLKGLNYNETIFRYLGIQLSAEEPAVKAEAMQQGYRPHTYGSGSGFAVWHPSNIQPRTMLDTYYQFYPALEPYEVELRDLILKGLQSVRDEMSSRFQTNGAAFLHVRRGDYLDIPHIHFNQSLSYYEQALSKLPASVEKILVFSDDVEWLKGQTLFQGPRFEIVPADLDEIQSLTLMSLCTEGAICANSTFSWWGAFLGAYGKRSPVVVPSRWISDPPLVSLFPNEWTVI